MAGQKGICTVGSFLSVRNQLQKERMRYGFSAEIFLWKPEHISGHEGGKKVGKRIIEKGALRVRWILLCAAMRTFWQEFLQQPKQMEYINIRSSLKFMLQEAGYDEIIRLSPLIPEFMNFKALAQIPVKRGMVVFLQEHIELNKGHRRAVECKVEKEIPSFCILPSSFDSAVRSRFR